MGIGTTTPSEKMEVNGNIKSTAYLYSSDSRLKKDITPLTSPLEKILALHGYSFIWKDTDKKDIGVIAQEVEKIFPEIVHTSKTDGYKSVEYGNLVAPIIEAIRELYTKIDDKQKEIEKLREENLVQQRKINDLSHRLDILESRLR